MARSFNGTSDKIASTYTSGKVGSKTMSVSMWFYPTAALNVYYGLMTENGTFFTFYFRGGKIVVFTTAGSYDGSGLQTLSVNNWYNVVFVLNAAQSIVTVNTLTDATVSLVGGEAAGTVWLGNDFGNQTRWLSGSLADVAIWNDTALSRAEISALYNGVSPLKIRRGNISAYWPLYGVQSPEPDLSYLRHNGTLSGTTFFADPPRLQRTNLNSDILYLPGEGEMPIMSAGVSFISGWSRQSNLPVIGGGAF